MEDVSDPPFRALCKEGGADVVYTEFISSEGLIRDAAKSVQKLDIYEKERPVGIQIFGANLDSMLRAVEIVEATNPDIIDINFGCPVKKVVCKGAGAGILKDIPMMVKLTEAMAKRTNIPLTVKTRLGGIIIPSKLLKWQNAFKTSAAQQYQSMAEHAHKCTKGMPTGLIFQKSKTTPECIYRFLVMEMLIPLNEQWR